MHFVYSLLTAGPNLPLSSLLMAQTAKSHQEALDQKHARARRNLENAWWVAAKKTDFDLEKCQAHLKHTFWEQFRKEPYDWQVDISEALIFGLDSIVIAGTSSGKTMPFMMPLLVDLTKKVLVILPLKVLQSDQVKSPYHYNWGAC